MSTIFNPWVGVKDDMWNKIIYNYLFKSINTILCKTDDFSQTMDQNSFLFWHFISDEQHLIFNFKMKKFLLNKNDLINLRMGNCSMRDFFTRSTFIFFIFMKTKMCKKDGQQNKIITRSRSRRLIQWAMKRLKKWLSKPFGTHTDFS